MKLKIIIFSIVLLCNTSASLGQTNRLNTHENIGWYCLFGTFKINNKLGIHSEYQWRRDNVITDWQQSLLRLGINYQLNQRILFRAGYAWVETFPYGEIPLNNFGKDYTEHRIFEMAQLSHREGIVELSHRFMLEQRHIGGYSNINLENEDKFLLSHRLRYMVRLQIPLQGAVVKDKTPYAALYNEIFVAFGKNTNSNVFDQNRIGVLLGYRFTENLKIEGGYLNQILQYGRKINGQNVFQNNNGIIINANFSINLAKT
ncbi:MAG: DUF2490 domain-containing protein [Bacteroidetes bacterium]|nr:DUF2490 domain-containing protein [Bacteroidota bacterium]